MPKRDSITNHLLQIILDTKPHLSDKEHFGVAIAPSPQILNVSMKLGRPYKYQIPKKRRIKQAAVG